MSSLLEDQQGSVSKSRRGPGQSVLQLLNRSRQESDRNMFAKRLARARRFLRTGERGGVGYFRLLRLPGFFASRAVSRRKPAFSPPWVDISALDVIFSAHLFIALAIAVLIVTSPGNSLRMLVDHQSIYLPEGIYSGAFLRWESGDPGSLSETGDPVDTSRFEALQVSDYEIQAGDTLGQIAIDHSLYMDTLISFNQISNVRRMQVGAHLSVPNRDGLLHQVEGGDTLSGLSDEYDVEFNAILDANSMTSAELQPGQALFIPGARMNSTDLRLVLGELFIRPSVGRFTSGFGYRADPFTGVRRFHNGADWARYIGSPIKASMGGTVVHVERQLGNYGRFVIIQHHKGFQTLYAHMNTVYVRRGQYVSQGEVIGEMGNTGRSTGPHLHFSIIKNGAFVDPTAYLH